MFAADDSVPADPTHWDLSRHDVDACTVSNRLSTEGIYIYYIHTYIYTYIGGTRTNNDVGSSRIDGSGPLNSELFQRRAVS